MSVGRYNAEHYRDPTAHKALTAAVREEQENYPKVYICSPFSGDTELNTDRAIRYALFAFTQGKCPVAPHIYFTRFMDDNDPEQRALGLSFALEWLARCEEVWVFGEKLTAGMLHELDTADRKEIPVRYFDMRCQETTGRSCP